MRIEGAMTVGAERKLTPSGQFSLGDNIVKSYASKSRLILPSTSSRLFLRKHRRLRRQFFISVNEGMVDGEAFH